MIGLQFKIENKYDKVLNKIFYNINCSNYKWEIINEEVLGLKGQDFFLKNEYDDYEFQRIIKNNHYPIFLTLKMTSKTFDNSNFKNYNQFLNSTCELILFITDSIFVDLYVKNQVMLEKIYKNLISFGYTNIKYINNENEFDRLLSLN